MDILTHPLFLLSILGFYMFLTFFCQDTGEKPIHSEEGWRIDTSPDIPSRQVLFPRDFLESTGIDDWKMVQLSYTDKKIILTKGPST